MEQFPPSAHAGQTSETYGTSGTSSMTSSTTLGFPTNYTIPSQTATRSGFPATYGLSEYTAGWPGFPAASSYMRPGFPVASIAASYTTTPMEFPAAGANVSSGGYIVSYPTASLSPSTQLDLDNIPKFSVQTSGASTDMQDEDDQADQDEAQYSQADGDTRQHGAPSHTESKCTIVRVHKVSHKLGSDDFVFNDTKGRSRTTKRTDWKNITYNGTSA